jgi:acyl dehydratase
VKSPRISEGHADLLAEGNTDVEEVERFLEITRDLNPLHRDPAFAKAKGFPGAIVPAGLSSAWLLRQLDATRSRALDLELVFVHPLVVGEPFRIWHSQKGPGLEELTLETHSGEVCVVLRFAPPADGA